jgi:phage terminase large subunit
VGRIIDTNLARVFVPLEQPGRYIGAHGGRGSAKSHYFAEKLVRKCVRSPGTHAVCIREVQKSLAQSAKRTIEGKIQSLGVGPLFDVQKAEIKTPGGGLIIFQGMQNHTADSIKSLEGYDVAWVEEAQTLSQTSLRLLRPTLRKPGSELWFSWNPKKATDPVDDFLRGNSPDALKAKAEGSWSPPPRSVVIQANWQDNPWFHETELPADKDYDFKRDRDMYAHVWGGEYEKNSQARVFKNWKVEEFDPPPSGTILYGGADWGFSQDPTVGLICFIVGRTLYFWREVWKIGCDIDQTPALFDQLDPGWTPSRRKSDPNWRSLGQRVPFIADSARPETISYMQKHGYSQIQAALKGAGSIEDGIEFLKSYDIIIHPDCVHTAQEFEHYSFKIDPHTDEITNILEDKKNHTIDSARYAVENVRRAVSAAYVPTGFY